MKKTIFTFALCILSTFPFTADAEETETAYERVMRTGIFRCAYASVGIPIQKNLSSGEITGPLADIARAMTQSLDLKLEWTIEVGYADFAEGLKSGRYDAFCGIISATPSRARVATFTTPLFYTPFYIYTRKDETRFKKLEDLNQSEIISGTVDGEAFQKVTRTHFPSAQEHSLPNMTDPTQLFVDLDAKKIDFVLHDPLKFRDYEKNNTGKVKRAFTEPLEFYPVGFAINSTEHELKDMLNTAISSLHNTGKMDQILTSHDIDKQTYFRPALPYRAE